MPLTDDLVEYWEFEDSPGMLVGSHAAITLTNVGGTVQGTGRVGEGADFEASSTQYFTHVDSDALRLGIGAGAETDVAFTFAFWMNGESTLSTLPPFIIKWDGTAAETIEYLIRWGPTIAPGFASFVISDGASIPTVESADNIGTSAWTFYVCWHDPAANVIAIQTNNGTPVTTAHTTGTWADNGTFHIGADFGGTRPFDGVIDQVGFWKRVLTSDEKTFLFNAGAGRSYADVVAEGGGALLWTPQLPVMGGASVQIIPSGSEPK